MAETKKQNLAPVERPTWYGEIRNMFTQEDIDHMKNHELDLSSYDDVKNSAGNIYGQVATGRMPRGIGRERWTKDWVDTFSNWMSNDFPKGTPKSQTMDALRSVSSSVRKANRIRKEITTLSKTELDNLKKAFSGIMALDPNDSNSYFVQASYHWLPKKYCQNHLPGYNPWHRAYLVSFENALRSIPGCENVTLPYWDITSEFPEILNSEPFDVFTLPYDVGLKYKKGYKTSRYSSKQIQQNLLTFTVTDDINRALSKTDWGDFHGTWGDPNNNVIIEAHDAGHVSIGDTMAQQDVAAFDPIFWFFHCNWDRLFWQWQNQMKATHLNGLMSTIDKQKDPLSYEAFTSPTMKVQYMTPFSTGPLKLDIISVIDSVNNLDIDYEEPKTFTKIIMSPKTMRSLLASQKFFVRTDFVDVRVEGLNRLKIPGSFKVHLLNNGKVIASKAFFQPDEADKCESCVKNAVVHFDFELPLNEVSNGKLGVWVEPVDKSFIGDSFPNKLMGNPTVNVHFLLSNE
jgi:tyrosinase